jgi:hypothetical protein
MNQYYIEEDKDNNLLSVFRDWKEVNHSLYVNSVLKAALNTSRSLNITQIYATYSFL